MKLRPWFKPYWKYTDEEIVENARKFAGIADLIHAPLLIVLGTFVIGGAGFGGWAVMELSELVQDSRDQPATFTATMVAGLLGWMPGLLVCLAFGILYLRRDRHLTRALLRTWERMKELEQVIAATSDNQIKPPPAGSPLP